MTFPEQKLSWIRIVMRVYAATFALLLIAWSVLFWVNFLDPHYSAPDISDPSVLIVSK